METTMQTILFDLQSAAGMLAKYTNILELPVIERDILLSKIRNAYEAIYFEANETEKAVKPLLNTKSAFQLGNSVTDSLSNKVNDELGSYEHDELHKENLKVTGPELILDLDDEKVKPIEEKIETNNSVSEPFKNEDHNTEHKAGNPIVAERFNKNQTLINEKLAQGLHKKDVSSLMQSKPVKDIETAIGINERFVFVRELFSGDTETFLKTIRLLNNAANFNEAFNYIRQTFAWNLDGEAAQKLLEIVRRRFIVDSE